MNFPPLIQEKYKRLVELRDRFELVCRQVEMSDSPSHEDVIELKEILYSLKEINEYLEGFLNHAGINVTQH